MEKIASNGPKWGRELFFPTNPDLADILGRTDFDFDFFVFCWSQISRYPGSKFPEIWPGPGLGLGLALAWAGEPLGWAGWAL